MVKHNSKLAASLGVILLLTGSALGQSPPSKDRKFIDPVASEKALQEAITILDKVRGDGMIRARLLCDIASFRRQQGDRRGAVAVLTQARTIAESGQRNPISEWRQIGEEYARLGNSKAILDLASAVPVQMDNWRGNPRETVLQEAARAAAASGHIKAAEQVAESLPDTAGRKSLQEYIARQAIINQAENGDVAGAIKAATKLPTAADTVFSLVGRPIFGLGFDDAIRQVDSIASAQYLAGNKEGAAKTSLSALALLPEVQESRRGSAALAVVRMLARLDDIPAARKALSNVPADDPKRAGPRQPVELMAKAYLAAAEVRAGRDDVALKLANDFAKPGEQAYVLHFVALAQAQAGRKEASSTAFSKAIELVGKANDPDGGGTSLHNIASAQAAAGDFAGAARTAGLQAGGTIAWANLAHYQTKAGDFAAARKAATDHLSDSRFWAGKVLQFVAEEQGRSGQATAVREWIDGLDDRVVQAHALFGLAKGLSKENEKRPAKE